MSEGLQIGHHACPDAGLDKLRASRRWQGARAGQISKVDMVFVLDDPNVIFPYIPFQDDHTERLVEMCSPETYPLQNANGNGEVIIIADTRHILRGSERLFPCSAKEFLL